MFTGFLRGHSSQNPTILGPWITYILKGDNLLQNRNIRIAVDAETGKPLAFVPLGSWGGAKQKEAILFLEDYERLINNGLSGNWSCHSGSYVAVTIYDKETRATRKVLINRVLMGAKVGERVRYKNGNPLDLRRSNLQLEQTHGLANSRIAI